MSKLRTLISRIALKLKRNSVPLSKYQALQNENAMLKTDIMQLAINYNKLLDYVEKKEAKDDQIQKLLTEINKKLKILEKPKYMPRLSKQDKRELDEADENITRLIFSKTRKKIEGFERVDISKYRE